MVRVRVRWEEREGRVRWVRWRKEFGEEERIARSVVEAWERVREVMGRERNRFRREGVQAPFW